MQTECVEKVRERKGGGSARGRNSLSSPAPLHPMLTLQQQAGNQAVQGLLRSGSIQAKLTISSPEDPDEQEADRVADHVMRAHAGAPATGQCGCAGGAEMCEECQREQSTIQRRASGNTNPAHTPDMVGHVLSSPGHPLDGAARTFFEPRFGRNFSHVRVHTGAKAAESSRAINALAYTAGPDIVFGAGMYAPGTPQGAHLLAHELAHVAQQDESPRPIVNRQDGCPPDRQSSSTEPDTRSKTCSVQCSAGEAFPAGTSIETFKYKSVQSTANDVQQLVLGNCSAAVAPVLEQLWIRDMIDVLKILNRSLNLDSIQSAASDHPRIVAAIKAIKDPQHLDVSSVTDPAQQAELKAFTSVRSWPTELPMQGPLAPVDEETQKRRDTIVDFIRRARAALSSSPQLKRVQARGAEVPGGYIYPGQKKDPLRPELEDPDPWRTSVNAAIWAELGGGEGGASAVNTWDRARLTLGSGFAAGGQLEEVMQRFLKSHPPIESALLDAGFAFQNNQWLAVDLSTGFKLQGKAALDSIRNEPSVLSLFIEAVEQTPQGQQFINAEWATLRNHAANVPDTVRDWPLRTIVFVAHCVHWGGLSWPQWTKIGPDLSAIIRAQAVHVPRVDPAKWKGGGALKVLPVATGTFVTMAGGLAKTVLEAPAPLPDDISNDTTSYGGHIFFDAGKNTFWHLPPS